MSIVCEEIFDETSHPSIEEIRDYATKIGIDPDSEPQLLPLATEGLMKALPLGWKPCYDDKKKTYYYYNNLTKKTQWEHPLDEIYRGLVKKAREASHSISINEQTEDATYIRDDLPSFEEAFIPKKLEPVSLGTRKKDLRLAPLKPSPGTSPLHSSKLMKQKSEDIFSGGQKVLSKFSSLDEGDSLIGFNKHPRILDKTEDRMELKISGGGSMFLKSNTKKSSDLPSPSYELGVDQQPRSILRERNALETSKSTEFDKISFTDKSDKDDEDKKSVRFNLDNNTTDVGGITFSDKSSSSEDDMKSDNKDENKLENIINVKLTPSATHKPSRFSVLPVAESSGATLKLIKPNPTDFVKPKLTLSKNSESDEDTKSLDKVELKNINSFFDSDSNSSPDENVQYKLENKADKKMTQLKQNIWEEKNKELVDFKSNLEKSHKAELDRLVSDEKLKEEESIKTELERLKTEMDTRTNQTIVETRLKYKKQIEEQQKSLEDNYKKEEQTLKEHYESKKEELEKYYEEKLVDIEKELADKVEKSKDELNLNHSGTVEQLKQNHYIIIEELKREFRVEEQVLRQEHQAIMTELKAKHRSELELEKNKPVCDERQYEKLRCEKRLLEDKYRCLKEKYLRLKTDVKVSIEKRNKRKEQSATTNTTGSETEQSHSNNKEKTTFNSPSKKLLNKPPTPNQQKSSPEPSRAKTESKLIKQAVIQDLDTSASDNCYQSDEKANQNDSSDSLNPGRSRKKLFSRLKSSSTSRINVNTKSRKSQRSCSPVENLRRQLQKLEDLEDQFPQNSQSDTYHLRYPFSDGQKFEGSSELEFFRHRIHLERDSIKRAKESLRSQKSLFQQRQKELKLKHGSMARHTLQQLCQEEKELTDMEVNLHRTRSLLGEKVIRLRHLEQSLQRANVQNDHNKHEDATLSDISSHSASSGISSTEFAMADANYAKALMKGDFQESSEIIQSLENLNSEIREIWDVLRTQQQHSSLAQVIPPLVYPDLGWPILAGAGNIPAPPSIPTLADRLHNYRQHVALANAQSTVVTHATQGATTTLVERTRNLRNWLRQTGIDVGNENSPPQTTL